MCRRFGTLCSIFISGVNKKITQPTKMEQSVPKRRHIKIQTPGNHPQEKIQHSQHGESVKSRFKIVIITNSKKFKK